MTRKKLLNSPEYWKMKFSTVIYEAMKSAKLTQKELAGKLGMSQPFISQIVNDIKSPSIETFIRILMVCGKVPIITTENLKDQK